ncbi:unnamed protein product [Amoebophrya sp. A120]|nr:unnamed protein product [Amoebophrya sp. A120]|eukprot:GSA120T00018451001.1
MTTVVDAVSGAKSEESTQWEDWHRKLGNFAPKEKAKSSDYMYKVKQNQLEAACRNERNVNLSDVSKAERAAEETADEDSELAAIRRLRMEEMQRQQARDRFGTLHRIRKVDFVREVNQASCVPLPPSNTAGSTEDSEHSFGQVLEAEEVGEGGGSGSTSRTTQKQDSSSGPEGEAAFHAEQCARTVPAHVKCFWVVVLLTGPAVDCAVEESLLRLAAKFRSVKFVSGSAEEMMPGFPAAALPALFLYNRGACRKQLFLKKLLLPLQVKHMQSIRNTAHADKVKNHGRYLRKQTELLEYLLFEHFVLESVVPQTGGKVRKGRIASAVGPVQVVSPLECEDDHTDDDEQNSCKVMLKKDRCYINKAVQARTEALSDEDDPPSEKGFSSGGEDSE